MWGQLCDLIGDALLQLCKGGQQLGTGLRQVLVLAACMRCILATVLFTEQTGLCFASLHLHNISMGTVSVTSACLSCTPDVCHNPRYGFELHIRLKMVLSEKALTGSAQTTT